MELYVAAKVALSINVTNNRATLKLACDTCDCQPGCSLV